jgi:hypothetical protein
MLLLFRCLALALVSLLLPGCQSDLRDQLPLGAGAKSSAPGKKARPTELSIDCDDLPTLTPEELARGPRELRLERSVPASPTSLREAPRFTVLADVTLSDEAEARVARIDEAYARKTGEHLVVTSGTRDAAQQAKAMYKMIELGADLGRLYRNKLAVREVQVAYDGHRGKPPEDAVTAIYEVLKAQLARGVYISAHLRAGAVDVRSRGMSAAERRAFVKAVTEAGAAELLEESKPPHYHLQID